MYVCIINNQNQIHNLLYNIIAGSRVIQNIKAKVRVYKLSQGWDTQAKKINK